MIPADESAMFAMTLPNQDVAFPSSVSSEVLFNEQEMKEEGEMSTSEYNMDSNDNSNNNSNEMNDMTTEETTQDQNEINESSVETSQSKSELSYSEQEQEQKQEREPEPEPEPERKHARGRSEEREQESDGDWMLLPESEIFENPSGRSPPKMWTKEECNRLHTAINRFGVGHWTEIMSRAARARRKSRS